MRNDNDRPVIEIKGVQFVNKGAELMLHAVVQQLQQLMPDAEIVLRPNKGSPYHKRVEVSAYQKLTLTKSVLDLNQLSYRLPRKLRNWLKTKWGVLTEADVDIILDASGFAYGDQWSSVALRQLSTEVTRFHNKNKTYIFLPQALGPFTREVDRDRLRISLPKAKLILAREKSSFDHVKGLGVDEVVVKQFPDFTNLVEGIEPKNFNGEEAIFLVIPNSKMLGAKNPDASWRKHYLQVLQESVSLAVSHGMRAVILNHEGSADQKICEELNDLLIQPLEIICEANPLRVKGIIGASKIVICSRFHGCVSALSQGVPCIGTSWSYKYERLFEDYERADFLLRSPKLGGDLKHVFSQALDPALDDNSAQILILKQRTREMWETVAKRLFPVASC